MVYKVPSSLKMISWTMLCEVMDYRTNKENGSNNRITLLIQLFIQLIMWPQTGYAALNKKTSSCPYGLIIKCGSFLPTCSSMHAIFTSFHSLSALHSLLPLSGIT